MEAVKSKVAGAEATAAVVVAATAACEIAGASPLSTNLCSSSSPAHRVGRACRSDARAELAAPTVRLRGSQKSIS